MRQLAAGLGAGAVFFGVLPAVFPRFFARLFGIAASAEPSVATAIRSVGVRDVVLGVGLLQAARTGDQRAMRQWLLARAASDAGDAISVAVALAEGERSPRFVGLGGLALVAAILGIGLARARRQA
jgi:hypothetical protein